MDINYFIYGSLVLAVIFMFVFNHIVMNQSVGNKRVSEIGDLIQVNAMKFMKTEYLYIGGAHE